MIDVLLLEDDPSIGFALARLLGQYGFDTHVAGTIAEARQLMLGRRVRSALLDLMLPDGNGHELIPILLASNPGCHIVVCTGAAPKEGTLEAMGVSCVIVKPIQDWKYLVDKLAGASEGRRLV